MRKAYYDTIYYILLQLGIASGHGERFKVQIE